MKSSFFPSLTLGFAFCLTLFFACEDSENLDGFFLDASPQDDPTNDAGTGGGGDIDGGSDTDAGMTVLDSSTAMDGSVNDGAVDPPPEPTEICLEAEAATNNSGSIGNFSQQSDANASGGAFMDVPNNGDEDLDNEQDGGNLVFSTTLPDAGPWNLWLRVRVDQNVTDGNDSFWVNVGDGFRKWNMITASGSWVWVRAQDTDDGDSIIAITEAGARTITIKFREDGISIDAIRVQAASDAAPSANCAP